MKTIIHIDGDETEIVARMVSLAISSSFGITTELPGDKMEAIRQIERIGLVLGEGLEVEIKTCPKEIQVVVELDGGQVMGVIASSPAVDLLVADYDCEEGDSFVQELEGGPARLERRSVRVAPDLTQEVIESYDEELRE